MRRFRLVAVGALATIGLARPARAQAGGMTHTPGMQHTPGMSHESSATPTQGGQAAFVTIKEIVQLLQADSTTDWSTVNLEALRQHLIDMDLVTLRARVKASPVAGGLTMDITGEPVVAAAITRMLSAHGPMLEADGPWRATVSRLPAGMRFTVVARSATDSATVTRIRGLGFIGLMVVGDHHPRHHLAIARGAGAAAHEHR